MKNKKYIILFLIALLYGCSDFLDKTPIDFISPETYYATEDELNAGLMGVYDPLSRADYYGSILTFRIESATTDEGFHNRSGTQSGLGVNLFTYTDPDINNLWTLFYGGIERANMLIANIDNADIDEEKRQNILAQALFLRGYYYFMLVTNFGDIPLKLEPTGSAENVYVPRTPLLQVYEQVLKDMKSAEPHLKAITSYGHPSLVSQTACQGILARVCLKMAGAPLNDKSKFNEALMWAQKVKDSGEHRLLTTFNSSLTNSAYSQIFINHSRDEYDIGEGIWEAEFSGNLLNNSNWEVSSFAAWTGIQFVVLDHDTIPYTYGMQNTTKMHYDRYGEGDLRRDWAIAPYRRNGLRPYNRIAWPETAIYQRNVAKWRRQYEVLKPYQKNFSATNFPILRYADVLLMIAEADNEVNNGPTSVAYDALNQVRRRGYGMDINTSNAIADAPAGMNQLEFREYVQEERSRELCYEGLRKHDLIRWGIFLERMNEMIPEMEKATGGLSFAVLGFKNISERNLLFPIPSGEMTINKAITENNPGW